MNPCVKFYRNIVDWKWFHVAEMVQLIMFYVCKADHEPYSIDGIVIEKGQVSITRKDVCAMLGISEQTFKTCMRRLVEDGKVAVENGLFKRSIVTVLNYPRYMVDDSVASQSAQPQSPKVETEPPKPKKKEKPKEDVVEAEVLEEPITLFSEDCPNDNTPISPARKKKEDVDCEFIVKLYHDRCPSLPKVLKLTDKRKMKIRVRFEEMKFSYETLQEVFDRSEASFFMRGDNRRGWKADFDWIFANSQNWVKVIEGKYDNKISQYVTNGTTIIPTATAWLGSAQPDRNATNIARQKYDILNTLAKCQQDYDAGNLPALTGVEEEL